MGSRLLKLLLLVCFCSLLILSCKKDDPKPLGAQTNAIFLAGNAGKSKGWKLREFSVVVGTSAAQTVSMQGCFADNLYTFYNNNSQDYEATEGTSKCIPTDPDLIEAGAWAFTLDGLVLNVSVDETFTPNGLFSPEIFVNVDDMGAINAIYNAGYTPYTAFVSKLDANNLVLEVNINNGGNKAKYTLTFTPA